MGSSSRCSGDGLEGRCVVRLVCLVDVVHQISQIGQSSRYSFCLQLEGGFAEFLEKLLDEGLTFLFQDPTGHGDPVVQLRL